MTTPHFTPLTIGNRHKNFKNMMGSSPDRRKIKYDMFIFDYWELKTLLKSSAICTFADFISKLPIHYAKLCNIQKLDFVLLCFSCVFSCLLIPATIHVSETRIPTWYKWYNLQYYGTHTQWYKILMAEAPLFCHSAVLMYRVNRIMCLGYLFPNVFFSYYVTAFLNHFVLTLSNNSRSVLLFMYVHYIFVGHICIGIRKSQKVSPLNFNSNGD